MFDLLAQGASAYNQVMLLVMALAFMGIGGFLLGYEIHWRLRALHVTGTVIGVRETKPSMYRNVYEYSLPGSTETLEATSNIGSNSARGRETGRHVELLVLSDRPERVSEASTWIAGAFGAVFFSVGFWPLHAAFRAGPVTWVTWAMLIGGAALFAYRAHARFISKGERKSPAEWQSKRREEVAAVPIRRIEDLLVSPEAIERRQRDEKQFRVLRPFVLLIGIGALGFAVHLGQRLLQLERAGLRSAGTVISLHADSGSDGPTYRPVVRFVAQNGATTEFKDRMGSNPASYQIGDRVTVLYESSVAGESARIDRGKGNWMAPVGLGLFGGWFVFAGLRFREGSPQSPGG
jgi:hypothetical protein